MTSQFELTCADMAVITDSTGCVIVIVDVGGVIRMWSAGAEAILGWPADAVVGRAIETIAVADQRRHVADTLQRIVRDARRWRSELPVIHANGSVVDLAFTVSPVLEGGTVMRLVLVGVDVTEHRRTAQHLLENENRLAETQRLARLGSWSWDVATDTIEWSDELFRIFGLDRSSFRATYANFLELIHPDDRSTVETAVGETFQGRDSYEIEHRVVRGDGAVAWIHGRGAVDRDETGAPTRLAGTAQDITDRRHADELRCLLAAIVDSSDDAVSSYCLDGRVASWNDGAASLFGYSAEEMIGKRPSVLVPDGRCDEIDEIFAKVLGGKPVRNVETLGVHQDGSIVAVSLTASPVLDATGKIVGISTIARDITDRKRLEAELEAARDQAMEVSRLKSDFLAAMSHEIRTPMNGVIGMTSLLLDTQLDDEQRGFAEIVRGSGQALLDIINDILDFSKIEAGKIDLEIIDFDLRRVVEEVADLLVRPAHTKGLELATVVAPDVPSRLRGDPGRIRQVLTNLVGNAVKFTHHGEVVVRVERIEQRGEVVVVRIEVTDTGIGIAPAARSALFDPFSQADSSTTRTYGGTGLGLAISKQLVELMDGQISVESEPGGGSAFSVTLPLAEQRYAPVLPSAQVDLNGLRVLVVDDNATNRSILARHVASWGMVATVSEGGPEALAVLRAATSRGEAFDVALIDMDMPGMNGLELARAIRDDPGSESVALLLLTSSGVRGSAAAAQAAGFSAFLNKPVHQSQLLDTIATVIGATTTGTELVTQQTVTEARARPRARILVAEDNVVNQKVAAAMLAKLGYRADVVANGAEALEAVSRISYGAVLMDCQMPEMDGYMATAEIRRQEKGGGSLPVIAMTAAAMDGDRERCFNAGMNDFIAKPVTIHEIAAALDRWAGPGRAPVCGCCEATSPPTAAARRGLPLSSSASCGAGAGAPAT